MDFFTFLVVFEEEKTMLEKVPFALEKWQLQ